MAVKKALVKCITTNKTVVFAQPTLFLAKEVQIKTDQLTFEKQSKLVLHTLKRCNELPIMHMLIKN